MIEVTVVMINLWTDSDKVLYNDSNNNYYYDNSNNSNTILHDHGVK